MFIVNVQESKFMSKIKIIKTPIDYLFTKMKILTEECLIGTLWYNQKMTFLNPKFNKFARKLPNYGTISDSKIPKNF